MTTTPWAVVCDFDGTATEDDLADALSIAYLGYDAWKQANAAYLAGRITFVQLLRAMFEPMAVSPEEVRAFAITHVRFRSGFERLVTACRLRSVPFVVASGGLDNYILPALETLPHDVAAGLDIRANRLEFPRGTPVLTFPHEGAPGACGTCGSCKGAVVKALQAGGRRVVAVGDGNADRCMAGVADVLFARGRLLEWCGREGVPCEPFETLDVVADRVEHLAGDEASWRSDDHDCREDVSCQGEGQWT